MLSGRGADTTVRKRKAIKGITNGINHIIKRGEKRWWRVEFVACIRSSVQKKVVW